MSTRAAAPSLAEVNGRAAVVGRLANYCTRHGLDTWATDDRGRPYLIVATWNDSQWLRAAKAAKVRTAVRDDKIPSELTRGMVIGILTGQANRKAASNV